MTPLYRAAKNNDLKMAKLLLSNKAIDIDKINQRGEKGTPLCVASRKGHGKVVKLLISSGANIEPKNAGYTPLCIAARNCLENVAEILINSGANVNYKNPLAAAISGRNLATARDE